MRRNATPVRPLGRVTWLAWLVLFVGLGGQVFWHAKAPGSGPRYERLGSPPSLTFLRVLSLSENALASRLVSLWLQAHDTQPGLTIGLRDLDYDRVAAWLTRALELDPQSNYPLLSAVRIYGAVSDDSQRRKMLDFVEARFLEAPDSRWRWMAEAAIVAKHRLKDLPLALRYANAIAQHAPNAPAWAREMNVVVLEDMGELEAARLLVGGLLHDGTLRDPHEVRFLEDKLKELEGKLSKNSQ